MTADELQQLSEAIGDDAAGGWPNDATHAANPSTPGKAGTR